MLRMRKKYIIILVFSAFVLGTVIYIKNVYLPRKLKAALVTFLDSHSPFKVKFSRLGLAINGNVHISNIKAKFSDGRTAFLLKDITADISLKDLLKKRLFFDSLKFSGLEIFLRRQGKKIDIWEAISKYATAVKKSKTRFPYQGHPASSTAAGKAGWGSKFFIYRIIIPRARLNFYDSSERFHEKFNVSIYVDLHPQGGAKIALSLSSALISLGYRAEANLREKTLEGEGVVDNLEPAQFMQLLNLKPKYQIKGFKINKWEYSLSLSKGGFVLTSVINLSNLDMSGRYNFESDVQAEGRISYEASQKKLAYELRGKLKRGRISGLPYVEEISHIESEFYLSNNSFKMTSFKGIGLGQPFKAELLVNDLENPHIYLSVNSQLDMSVVHKLGFLKKGVKLSGPALLRAEWKGKLKRLGLSNLKAEIELQGDEADFSPAASFKQIRGKIFLRKEKLSWENLQFVYHKTRLNSRGHIDNLASIKPVFSLSSDYFDLDASFFWNRKNSIIQDISLKGSAGRNTSFNLQASLDIAKGLFLKVRGIVNMGLEDIAIFTKSRMNKISSFLRPQGEIEVQLAGEGKLKDINSLHLQALLSSKQVSLHELRFSGLQALAALKEGELVVSPLECGFYQGDLQLRLKYSLSTHSFLANFKVVEANLEKIAADLGRAADDYAGRLSLDIDAAASDLKSKDTWRAEGRAEIKDGEIWKLYLFRGIEKLLPLRDSQKIVFRNGWANFSLEKKIITLEGLSLLSTLLEIKGKGTISLEGNLNLLVFLNISPPLIRSAPALNKIASFLLDNGFVTVEVKGSIKKPTYRLVPFFIKSNPVKKMKDFIRDIFNVFSE